MKYIFLFMLTLPAYANDEKDEPRVVYKQDGIPETLAVVTK